MAAMRGDDRQPRAMFSYVSAEERVPRITLSFAKTEPRFTDETVWPGL